MSIVAVLARQGELAGEGGAGFEFDDVTAFSVVDCLLKIASRIKHASLATTRCVGQRASYINSGQLRRTIQAAGGADIICRPRRQAWRKSVTAYWQETKAKYESDKFFVSFEPSGLVAHES
ncbi:MAG: hypothetical protein DMF76_26335 [Acidobacteria bacterium]|nr:MAG: hypothetical protein DMF76_26335 [Acidobacteriota bacterium]